MKGHGSVATICVTELPVRATSPNLAEAEHFQKRHHFARLEDWSLSHLLSHFDDLCADKDALETRITLLKQHLNNFLKVCVKLVECLALAVGTNEPGNPANVESGVSVALNDSGEVLHNGTSLSGLKRHWRELVDVDSDNGEYQRNWSRFKYPARKKGVINQNILK